MINLKKYIFNTSVHTSKELQKFDKWKNPGGKKDDQEIEKNANKLKNIQKDVQPHW